MQLTPLLPVAALLSLAQAAAVPVEVRSFTDGKAPDMTNLACSVGREKGRCDSIGRCVQLIPPNEISVLNQGAAVAQCNSVNTEGTQVPPGPKPKAADGSDDTVADKIRKAGGDPTNFRLGGVLKI